jgi:RNA polymerase sigma-70 factor, ECF subfamily
MTSSAQTRDLFEQARRGRAEDLDAFYERCGRKLLPIIRLRLGRTLRRDVESRDILQSVLCKSVEKLETVKDPGAVMSWLAKMADNEIRDLADFHQRQMRDSARRAPIDDAAAVPAPVRQALSRVIINEEAARVEAALESLTPAQRELIILRKLEELTFPQMAKRLNSTEDACRVGFSRAMAALLVKLGPQA